MRSPTKHEEKDKHGACPYICALDREIYQVEKDGELGCQIVEEGFFLILPKKLWMGSHLPN
jgi:hypothetical protein